MTLQSENGQNEPADYICLGGEHLQVEISATSTKDYKSLNSCVMLDKCIKNEKTSNLTNSFSDCGLSTTNCEAYMNKLSLTNGNS